MSALFGVPVDAAYHLVFALTNVFTPVLGGLAAVAAIVVFTVAARLLVAPLTFRALRGQRAQAALAPHVQRLRKQYARQPERLQRELVALYQRAGTSPLTGFAPLLAQWPVFSVLYLLFRSPTVAGGPNLLLSRTLFGAPLGSHLLSGSGAFSAHGAVFLGMLVLLAAACWLVTRAARRVLPQPVPGAVVPDAAGTSAVLIAVGKFLPYLTVLIAVFTPLAAAVYLVASTGWSAAERLVFAARTGRKATPVEPKPGNPPSNRPTPPGNRRNNKRPPRPAVRRAAENG